MPRRQKSPERVESSDDESQEEVISMGEIEDRLFKMDMDFGEMKVESTVATDIQSLIGLQRKLTEKVRKLLTEVRQYRTPTELKMVMQRAMHIDTRTIKCHMWQDKGDKAAKESRSTEECRRWLCTSDQLHDNRVRRKYDSAQGW